MPTISTGAKISRITVGAIEDLGYTVDYSGADAYGYSDLGSSCKCKGRRLGETTDAAAEEFTTDATTSTTPSWLSSNSNHSPRDRRRLSDAAHAKATADGRAFLEELVAGGGTKDAAAGRRALSDNDDEFIEHHTAVVYIEEDGEIYAVHVHAG